LASTPNNEYTAPIHDLTPRERAVLLLISEGLSNQEVADRLSVSKRTISTNLAAIFQKLGVHTRLQVVVQARQLGLLDALQADEN